MQLNRRATTKNLLGYYWFNRANADLPFLERIAKELHCWDTVHRIEISCSLLIIVVALTGIFGDVLFSSSQYDISALIPHISLFLTWVSNIYYAYLKVIFNNAVFQVGSLFVIRKEYTLAAKHNWCIVITWNLSFIVQCVRISSLHALGSLVSHDYEIRRRSILFMLLDVGLLSGHYFYAGLSSSNNYLGHHAHCE